MIGLYIYTYVFLSELEFTNNNSWKEAQMYSGSWASASFSSNVSVCVCVCVSVCACVGACVGAYT